ncbi:MAG: fatty acid desaturase family protein [Saprospiraceae bacterium]
MEKLLAADYLSKPERKALMEKDDVKATLEILQHVGWIVVAFALVYWWPTPGTVLLSLFILGGKQLACAILMHDTSHHAVFNHRGVNDAVGKWLGAYPIFQDMLRYRPYHWQHHVAVGTAEDPDLMLTRGYPTSRASMFRKFFRDLSGQTGLKAFVGLVAIHLGYLEYNLGGKVTRVSQKDRTWSAFFKTFLQHLGGPILANGSLFLLLWLVASPYLYLLWIGAYFTTFQFSLRVRSMAEHSMVEDQLNPLRNTRTTYANWLERLLFAPYHVNYHLEHHMLMAVPSYNLPKLHRLLLARGFYEKGLLEKNYWTILKMAVRQ